MIETSLDFKNIEAFLHRKGLHVVGQLFDAHIPISIWTSLLKGINCQLLSEQGLNALLAHLEKTYRLVLKDQSLYQLSIFLILAKIIDHLSESQDFGVVFGIQQNLSHYFIEEEFKNLLQAPENNTLDLADYKRLFRLE